MEPRALYSWIMAFGYSTGSRRFSAPACFDSVQQGTKRMTSPEILSCYNHVRGYTRILGELRRLGISRICRQTVKNIINEEGIEPSPKRSKRTWDEYLKAHAETLWTCDFFSVRTVTTRGLARLYILVLMHLETREVYLTTATEHPNSEWMSEQAKAFVEYVSDRDPKPTTLLRDRDRKFTAEFDGILKDHGIVPKPLPVRSPNLNARVERFVQTIKTECLRRFIIFGKQHLDYLVREFGTYYNEHRAHSNREFLPPKCSSLPEENDTINLDEIRIREHVGGLIKSYERAAA